MTTRSALKNPPIQVPKSRLHRIAELLNALQVIRDSLTALTETKEHYMIPLSGQLRALLTDHSRHARPLLIDLAKELKRELIVYATAAIDSPAGNSTIPESDILFRFGGVTLSLKPELPDQRQIPLTKALKRNVLYHKGISYSLEQIVNFFANRAGGAHYSKQLPRDLAGLINTPLWAQSPLRNALWQLGLVSVDLGMELLSELGEFEFHLVLLIPRKPTGHPACLVDARYPDWPMRYQLFIDPLGRLHLGLTDLHGVGISMVTRPVPISRPFYFAFKVNWTKALETEIELTLDGKREELAKVRRPLFLMAHPQEYDILINSGHDGSWEASPLCVGDFAITSRQEVVDRGDIMHDFLSVVENAESECVVYPAGVFGRMANGSVEMQLSKGARKATLATWDHETAES